jgi:hypothetical protein
MQAPVQERTNKILKQIARTTLETHKPTALYRAMHSNSHSQLHNAIFTNFRSNAAEHHDADNVNNVKNLTILNADDDVQDQMYSRSDVILAVCIAIFFAFFAAFYAFIVYFKCVSGDWSVAEHTVLRL